MAAAFRSLRSVLYAESGRGVWFGTGMLAGLQAGVSIMPL